MALQSPNKETIRRICTLFKCSCCWLLNNEENNPYLFVELKSKDLAAFKNELESWSGIQFVVFNADSAIATIEAIQLRGEQLLPVDNDTPLIDIEKRRKPIR